jgi:putative ABC transport system permease protein
MFLIRTFQLGLKSLLLHPMRSLLTVLGIFIGVASVIWLLAIGEGISIEAQKQIEGLGADNIIVRSIKPPAEATAGYSGPVPYGLKREEFALLRDTIPTIKSALPIREVRRTFSFDGRDLDGRLVGCTTEYFDVTRLVLNRGRLLTEADSEGRKNFCVIASGVAEKLFPYQDPLGRRIYLSESQDYYQVVGILKYRTPTAAVGGSLAAQDFSSDVYIPITTLRQQIGDFVVTRRGSQMSSDIVELDQVTLRLKSVDLVPSTAALVRETLNIPEDPESASFEAADKAAPAITPTGTSPSPNLADMRPVRRDVALVVPYELLEQARVTRMMFMLFMGLIAAISLLVGGIGIMNIMLATVTERTREIGIRRALGATQRHIVLQFLVETVSLSVVGGITGIIAGLFCPYVIDKLRVLANALMPEVMADLPEVVQRLQPQIVWGSLPLAFGISVMVGVVFGIYPAIRAAQMDPIEALRHE